MLFRSEAEGEAEVVRETWLWLWCGLSNILNCISRGPTRAIPVAFGVAEVGSALGSVDATAIAVGAGDRPWNWLEMTM